MDFMVNANTGSAYNLLMTATDQTQTVQTANTLVTIANPEYDTFQTATIQDSSGTLDLTEMDIFSPFTLKIKQVASADYKSIKKIRMNWPTFLLYFIML